MILAAWPLWTLPIAFLFVCSACAFLITGFMLLRAAYKDWRNG